VRILPLPTPIHVRYSIPVCQLASMCMVSFTLGMRQLVCQPILITCRSPLTHDEDVVAPIEREIRTLAHGLTSVKDEQEYIVIRERTHRNTAESTNARVKWWSILQTAVLFSVVAWQVYYLKVTCYPLLSTPPILTRLFSLSSRSRGSFKIIVIVVLHARHIYRISRGTSACFIQFTTMRAV